ncbi:MAG: hypothetical protein RLZZ546_123 [Bacteroidota bacterium]|jgi:putative SOS response-associated peptidase YedK
MCGRSSITKTEKELEQRFNATFYSDDLERYNPLPNFNVAPTHMHPLLINEDPSHIQIFKWGLVPFWSKDEKTGFKMINARVETLLEKTTFKNLVKSKRCIVPMDGFYEWKTDGKEKQPYRIFTKDQEIFTVAGLWDTWKNHQGEILHTYTIITLEANEFMRSIHDRMPAILTPQQEKDWLEGLLPPEDLIKILAQYDSSQMDAYPVDKKVGNVKERGSELIKAQPIVQQTSLF